MAGHDCTDPRCCGGFGRARIAANIEHFGVSLVAVFDVPAARGGKFIESGAADPASPAPVPFVYTIGNAGRGLPELLVVVDIDGRQVAGLLNMLAAFLRERGRAFDHGDLVRVEGVRVPFKVVDAIPTVRDDYMGQAGRYWGHDDYRVQQVLLCDAMGRFPGEAGCRAPFAGQPVLAMAG